MTDKRVDAVLQFWFPVVADEPTAMARQLEWWFGGGADAGITARFAGVFESAVRNELVGWSNDARSRLALIIVLDQFSRTLHRATPAAYAQDAKARSLTLDGLDNGHYAALEDPWQKTFFMLPLGHSEELHHLDKAVALAEEIARSAAPAQRGMLEFSANQARSHREVVAQFGRQPHRNAVLGRRSTAAELAYLAANVPVHKRRPSAL